MQTSRKNSLIWCWLAIAVIIADQLTKLLAVNYLTPYTPQPVLPLFNLTLMYNTGAAFSFLSRTNFAIWLFSGIAIVVSAVILYWLYKTPLHKLWLGCGLSLVLGGALSNLLDRLVHGYVIDMLDFYYANWHFPAFNLADSAITIGAALLLLDSLRKR